MKKLFPIIFAIITFTTISFIKLDSYPQADRYGCGDCHGGNGHKYKKGMIKVVKTGELTFGVYVNGLNKNKKYVIGAELVDKDGNIIARKYHTLKLPIELVAEKSGEHLLYVGGIYNDLGLVFDSAYANTDMSMGIEITDVSSNVICAGDSIYVHFKATEYFGDQPKFFALLSDKEGEFEDPLQIGSITGLLEGVIPCFIPNEIDSGGNYKIKVAASSADFSSLPETLEIQPPLNTEIEGETVINETKTYDYKIASGNRNLFEWTVTGGEIEYINKDKNIITVTWNQFGAGSVCVKETNNAGCLDSFCLNTDISVGVESGTSSLQDILIYPNPVDDVIFLEFPDSKFQDHKIEIFDPLGRKALMQLLTHSKGNPAKTLLDLSFLNPGFYFIRISSGERSGIFKILKK